MKIIKENKDNYSVKLENNEKNYNYVFPVSVWKGRKTTHDDSKEYHMPGYKRKTAVHFGFDFPIPNGTPILAISDGKVIYSIGSGKGEEKAGYYISIYHKDSKIEQSRYMHMSKVFVKPRDDVKKGDVIGLSGGLKGSPGSGNSTGPHLHFDIKLKGGGLSKKKSDYIALFKDSHFGIVTQNRESAAVSSKAKSRFETSGGALKIKATLDTKPIDIILRYISIEKEKAQLKDIDMSRSPSINVKNGAISIITNPKNKYAISLKMNDDKVKEKYDIFQFIATPDENKDITYHYDFKTKELNYFSGIKKDRKVNTEKKEIFPDLSNLSRNEYIDILYNISVRKSKNNIYPDDLTGKPRHYRSFLNFDKLPKQMSPIINQEDASNRAFKYIEKATIITQKKKDILSKLTGKIKNKQAITIIKRLAGQEKIALENRLSIEDFNPNKNLDYYRFTFKNSDIIHDIPKTSAPLPNIFIEGKKSMFKNITKSKLQVLIRKNLRKIILEGESKAKPINPQQKSQADADLKKDKLDKTVIRANFNSGKYTLKKEIKDEINSRMRDLVDFSSASNNRRDIQYTVKIVSGTSKVPVRGGNLALSEKRANAIKNYIKIIYPAKGPTTGENYLDAVGIKIEVDFKTFNEKGPSWVPSKGANHQDYKEHQFVRLETEATGILNTPRNEDGTPDDPVSPQDQRIASEPPSGQDQIEAKPVENCKRYGKNKTVFSISSDIPSLIYVKKNVREKLIKDISGRKDVFGREGILDQGMNKKEAESYFNAIQDYYSKEELAKNKNKIIKFLRSPIDGYIFLRGAPAAQLRIESGTEYNFKLLNLYKGLNLSNLKNSTIVPVDVKFDKSFFGKCFHICAKHYFKNNKTDHFIGYKGRRLDYDEEVARSFFVDQTKYSDQIINMEDPRYVYEINGTSVLPTFTKFKESNKKHISVTPADLAKFNKTSSSKINPSNSKKQTKIKPSQEKKVEKETLGSFIKSGNNIVFKYKKTKEAVTLAIIGEGEKSYLDISFEGKDKNRYKLEGIDSTGVRVKIESMKMKIKDISTIILSGEYLDPRKLLTIGNRSSKMTSITQELSQKEMHALLNKQKSKPAKFETDPDQESRKVRFTRVKIIKENFRIDGNLLRKIIKDNIIK